MGAPSSAQAGELAPIFTPLGLAPTQAQTTALLRYLDLLAQWNTAYNLTAVRDRGAMLTQHLADCLAILPALRREVAFGRMLDVGSGAGLPGVVVAILRPEIDVSCIDSVGKKAAFVRQVAGALGLSNLHALHGRVEDLAPTASFAVIVSRAFSTLKQFAGLTETLLSPQGVWLAMKGRVPDDEMAELPPSVEVFHVEPLQVPGLQAERCLIWMRRPRTEPAAGHLAGESAIRS